ncbi:MAG: hypothetical protein JWR85_971 [Marmoricola sp.]|nr:hypothetical protein [Marmoricola sp.]
MTDPSALLVPGQPSQVYGQPRPPGVVYAAAVVTWVAATGTAFVIVLLAVTLLWLAAPIFEYFESGSNNPQWIVISVAVVVVAVCTLADFAAVFILRGRRWAQCLLIALCVVAALAGAVMSYYIAPILVTAAAGAVVLLLLLPDARAWFRGAAT